MIDNFIKENGDSERDALNVALTRLENAEGKIDSLQKEVEYLHDELRRVTER